MEGLTAVRSHRMRTDAKEDLQDPKRHLQQGVHDYEQGMSADAIQHYETAKTLDPECTPIADSLIAEAFIDLGNFEEAIQLLRRNPLLVEEGETAVIILLAWAYMENGQPVRAYDLIKKIVSDESSNHAAFEILGLAYYHMKHFEEALACFRQAIKLKGNIARYHRQASKTLLQLERLQEALQAAAFAVSHDPNDTASRSLLADIYADLGDENGHALHRMCARQLQRIIET